MKNECFGIALSKKKCDSRSDTALRLEAHTARTHPAVRVNASRTDFPKVVQDVLRRCANRAYCRGTELISKR